MQSLLSTLNEGDKVIMFTRMAKSIEHITRITKSQILIGDRRFNRIHGGKIPYSNIYYSTIAPYTEELAKLHKLI